MIILVTHLYDIHVYISLSFSRLGITFPFPFQISYHRLHSSSLSCFVAHHHYYTQINSLHQPSIRPTRTLVALLVSKSLPLTSILLYLTAKIPRPIGSDSMPLKGECLADRSANPVIVSSATESQRMPSNGLSSTPHHRWSLRPELQPHRGISIACLIQDPCLGA